MELGLVQPRPVPEHAVILAETLAMIRGDDHPRMFKNGTTLELVNQTTKLLVEIRNAIVVRITTETDLVLRRTFLHQHRPIAHQCPLTRGAWIRTESVHAQWR